MPFVGGKTEQNIGKTFNCLTILSIILKKKRHQKYPRKFAVCKCVCGKITEVYLHAVASKRQISCGCHLKRKNDARNQKIVGKTFGEWTVTKSIKDKNKDHYEVEVRCSCGVVKVRSTHTLFRGESKSCGHIKNKCTYNVTSGFRRCSSCKGIFSLDRFRKGQKRGKIVLGSYCISCLRLRARLRQHDLSEERFKELGEKQNWKCAICSCKMLVETDRKAKADSCVIDHAHERGDRRPHSRTKIRGLICTRCNRGLGFLGSEELLRSALNYLYNFRINPIFSEPILND